MGVVSEGARAAVLLVGCAVVAGSSLVPSDNGPPSTDSCDSPGGEGITEFEIGIGEGDSFVALADGDAVELTRGDQGGYMLRVRFELRGSGIADCVPHRSRLVHGGASGALLAENMFALRTYESGFARQTKALFLVLEGPAPAPGEPLILTTQLGNTSRSIQLYRDFAPDAG